MKITNTICRWIVLLGLFAVPFIPFIVPSAMFFPFITGKGFAFRILIEIVFGAYLLLAFLDVSYRPKLSLITKSVLVFTGVMLLADLCGVSVYKSIWSNYERMEGFVLLFHLALYYIVLSSVFTTRIRWQQFWNVSIVASLAMSFYGFLQLLGKATIHQGGVRLDGTFGNASYFAIYLVFHIFLCLYMLVGSVQSKLLKWVYGLVAVFEIVILYFTATRGAILGLIGGLFLSAILIAWKEKENKKLRKVSVGVLVGVVVVIAGFFALRNTSFIQTSPVLSRFATIGAEEIKSQGRYFIWPMALHGIADRPLLGWGQENFNFVFNKYYDPRMYAQEQWFDRTHDVVLDWLIAGGILGFLAYASMYAALFYLLWKKENPLTVVQKSILTGMIAAYIFHNIFVFDNIGSYLLFFSVLGYIHSMSVVGKETTGSFFTKKLSETTSMYIALPLVVIATFVVVYTVNIPALRANQTLIQAISPQGGVDKNLELFKKIYSYNSFGSTETTEQFVQITSQVFSAPAEQVPDATKQKFYDLSLQKINEKLVESPNDARYFVFAGTFFNRFGKYDDAIKALTRALELSPKKQSIYFEIGTSYLGKGDYPKALSLLKYAYDLEPKAPESKVIYAIGAIYAHDSALLAKLAPGIDRSVVISDNRFLKAYADIKDFQTVIAILSERLKADPTNMQYKLSLASAYVESGQKQRAIAVIQNMIDQDPTFKAQGESYIKQIQNS